MKARHVAAAAIAASIAVLAGVPMAIGLGGAAANAASNCGLDTGTTGDTTTVPISPQGPQIYANLSATQLSNAGVIVDTGVSLRLPARAEVLAVAAALQESSLTNTTTPDATGSSGLFQETPPRWGTRDQVNDPVYASEQFYDHLLRIPSWQTRPLDQIDAAVERPKAAFDGLYARWERMAGAVVATILGNGASIPTACHDGGDGAPSGGGASLPKGYTLPAGTSPTVVRAIAYALAQLGKPYQWGATGPNAYDCSGLMMAAYHYAGLAIPRTTYQQVTAGQPVAIQAVEPGDLVFTPGTDGSTSNPGHVGMYIGDGLIIQAPHTGDVIKLTPYQTWATASDPIDRIVAIRRITD